jgi:hypothetical protein
MLMGRGEWEMRRRCEEAMSESYPEALEGYG